MNQEIIKLDPKQFGLEETKAADIAAQFQPMLDKMVELEKEYNEIITLPIEDAQTSSKAKVLRLKYVKVRTGTDKIHKDQKAFYLSAGRFVDGWKNAQLFAANGIEKKLEEIENYAANKEKERIAALQLERELLLNPYEVENANQISLGNMGEQFWENFLSGTKLNYETKKEAERKAEEDRLAAIEAEKQRIEDQRIENERLKKEAEDREKILAAERKEAARLASELKAKQDAEKAEIERLAKIESDRIAAEKKAAKAPIKDKLKVAISALTLQLPESEITPELMTKFTGFKQWALNQIESL